MDREIIMLLNLIDQAFDHKAWHGTNLKGSLRGMAPEEAAWRPGPGRHNVWEIAVHCAYWKYAVWRRLTGEKRGSFTEKGSNWFPRPRNGSDWKRLLKKSSGRSETRSETYPTSGGKSLTERVGYASGLPPSNPPWDFFSSLWKTDITMLGQMHSRLRDAIVALRAKDLATKPAGSKVDNLTLVSGIAAHDLYHTGQIQLLKRLRTKEN